MPSPQDDSYTLASGVVTAGRSALPSLPAWVPAANNVAVVPEAFSFASITPGTSGPNGYSYNSTGQLVWDFGKIIDDFSGGVYNPYYSPSGGSRGSMIFHGGGHSATNWGGVVAFDLTSLEYSIACPGSQNCYPRDTVNMEYADGQPCAPHSYDYMVVLGPEAGYPKGALFTPVRQAASIESGNTTAAHLFDFAHPELKWQRKSGPTALNMGTVVPCSAAAYDKDLGRVWWVFNCNQTSGGQPYFDLATNAHARISLPFAMLWPPPDADSQSLRYDPVRKLLILYYVKAGATERRIAYFSTQNPSAGWTRANLVGATLPSTAGGYAASIERMPDGTYYMYCKATLNTIYKIVLPDGAPSGDWTVVPITIANGGTLDACGAVMGGRWAYVPSLQSIVSKGKAANPVKVYRV